jgi:hypothetical protein
MMTSTTITSTQIYNVRMMFLKKITKSKVLKQMIKYSFGNKFHNLKYLKHDFIFYSLNSWWTEGIVKKKCRKTLI